MAKISRRSESHFCRKRARGARTNTNTNTNTRTDTRTDTDAGASTGRESSTGEMVARVDTVESAMGEA
jgi:hypothetical protein